MLYLNKRNIVHRDMKPDNILIGENNEIKLVDFGFARALEPEVLNTSSEMTALGTPYYMSPEMIEGNKSSSKCDVWSCGIIFYQILYGGYPFESNPEKYSI